MTPVELVLVVVDESAEQVAIACVWSSRVVTRVRRRVTRPVNSGIEAVDSGALDTDTATRNS